jgi:hypothetical protein
MSKRILALAALVALSVPTFAHAADSKGVWALGYWNKNAPIGIRYQATDKMGVDLAFGFQTSKGIDESSASTPEKTFNTFDVDFGLPMNLKRTERANFFFRPGVTFQMVPYYVGTSGTATKKTLNNLAVSGTLGAEWKVTDNLSLSVGHGIEWDKANGFVAPGDLFPAEVTKESTFGTRALSLTDLGFRWYFR